MRKINKNSELIIEYLTQYPKMQKKTLAKIIYEQNKKLIDKSTTEKDPVEYIRKRIMAMTGNSGKEQRQYNSVYKKFYDYGVPDYETDYTQITTFRIEVPAYKRLLVAGDFHLYYSKRELLEGMLTWALEHGVDSVLLNGDVMDCYDISFFARTQDSKGFQYELDETKRIIELIQKTLDCKIFYKEGNHEERLPVIFARKIPELIKVYGMQLENLLELQNFNCDYIKDRRLVRFSGLNILHGHEFGGGVAVPVNPARTALLKVNDNVMVSHYHKSSQDSYSDIDGNIKGAWSVGCLCDLRPHYRPYGNKWNAGFAFVKAENQKVFRVTNLQMSETGEVY